MLSWDPGGRKYTKKYLEKLRPGKNRIYPNFEERRPNGKRVRLDVLFEDLVDVRREPIPNLRLFLDRPVF